MGNSLEHECITTLIVDLEQTTRNSQPLYLLPFTLQPINKSKSMSTTWFTCVWSHLNYAINMTSVNSKHRLIFFLSQTRVFNHFPKILSPKTTTKYQFDSAKKPARPQQAICLGFNRLISKMSYWNRMRK